MTNRNEYNGWANYATWRINLEYGFTNNTEDFQGYDADELKEYVESSLEEDCNNEMTLNYALAFIDDINWYEIEEMIKSCIEDERGL